MYAGGGAALTPAAPAAPQEPWTIITRENTLARIEQDATIEEAQEAFIAASLRWDVRSPRPVANSRRIMGPDARPLRAAPEEISVPTLMIYGARDAGYRPEALADFFSKLNTTDKALVVVPDAGHFLIIQRPRMRLFTAAAQWFSYE